MENSKELAIKSFQAVGFPNSRLEEWKYTSLKNLNEVNWNWNVHSLSVAPSEGLIIISLQDLLLQSKEFKSKWEKRDPILDQNPFYGLNEKLCDNPLVLWVKKGITVENTIDLFVQLNGID